MARGLVMTVMLGFVGCGAPTAQVPPAEMPVEKAESPPPTSASAKPACPDGTYLEKDRCIREVRAPDRPAWKPPVSVESDRLDPCGAFTDPRGLVDCDPKHDKHDPAVHGDAKKP